MLRTPVCELLGIEHPVVLGGMGSGTGYQLVAAVCNAGGLGILGATSLTPELQAAEAEAIRAATDRPWGLNHLLCFLQEDRYAASLTARPRVMSTAWPWSDQDLRPLFQRARDAGCLVMHMVSSAPEAVRAVEAGADVIVAQGNEGGGHVGHMGTFPLVRMVVRAVAPVPVLAAGGVADGAGLAASLALGAQGVLLGSRFLATPEAPVPEGYKQAIVRSDGHDTVATEIPDVATNRVWPGALSRTIRNRFIERWSGLEWELRRRHREVGRQIAAAREANDAEEYALQCGQTAGLIDEILPASEVVARIVREAEAIIRDVSGLVREPSRT